MEVRICRLAKLQRQFHQFTHACLIQPCGTDHFQKSWYHSKYSGTSRVNTGESGHSRQIVCTETEEVCLRLYLVCPRQATSWNFYHRSHFHISAYCLPLRFPRLRFPLPDSSINFSSFASPTSGIMISGILQSGCTAFTLIAARITASVCIFAISGYVTARRHPRCPSIGVHLFQGVNEFFDSFYRLASLSSAQFPNIFFLCRNELMERRIQEPNRYRIPS